MSALDLFRNGEFELAVTLHPVDGFRVQAPGVARALGFRDAHRLTEAIPDGEKGYTTACTPGGDQRVWYLTEAGFYRALGMRQAMRIKNKPIRERVERFQAWVYGTVLPTIRRTGSYSVVQPPTVDVSALDRRALALMVIEAEDARLVAEAQAAALAPRAEAWDDLVESEGDYLVGDAAKILCRVDGISIGQNRLFRFLGEQRWTYRGGGDTGPWRAMQTAVDAGWLTERISTGFHVRDGEPVPNPPQVRVTTRGIARLRVLLLVQRGVAVIGA